MNDFAYEKKPSEFQILKTASTTKPISPKLAHRYWELRFIMTKKTMALSYLSYNN